MKERRKGMDEISNKISLMEIDVKILLNTVEANNKSMREALERLNVLVEKHNKTLYGNGTVGLTTKIGAVEDIEKSMNDHFVSDKWMFTTVIGLLLFTIGKLFWP